MTDRLMTIVRDFVSKNAHRGIHYFRDAARATIFPAELAGSKREFVLIYFIRLFFLVGRRLWNDNCPRQAAALSFQTILSIVPLAVLVLAAAAWLQLDAYVSEAVRFLENNLMPDVAAAAARRITTLAHSFVPGTLGMVGLLSLLVVALTLIFSVEQAVNEIFRCRQGRSLLVRIPLSTVLIVAAPAVVGLSIYFASLVLFRFSTSARLLLPLLVSVLLLFLVYWLLPHRKINKRHALTAAVIAGVAMEGLKWGFAWYVGIARLTLVSVYGAMAVVPLFLMWIYTAWLFFLFGAQLNAALHEVRDQGALDSAGRAEVPSANGFSPRG